MTQVRMRTCAHPRTHARTEMHKNMKRKMDSKNLMENIWTVLGRNNSVVLLSVAGNFDTCASLCPLFRLAHYASVKAGPDPAFPVPPLS